ncbi:MAG: hypothetical protein ABJG68_11395 [Crocinitomicaceae bacterium]
MKKAHLILFSAVIAISAVTSCEKEQPAENVEGNYTGVLDAKYDGVDTLNGSYPVFVTATTKNKVLVEGTLFPAFEVLVTQQGVNVDPVSTDANVHAFLYQGNLNELSFTYYKGGDTAVYVGTKP